MTTDQMLKLRVDSAPSGTGRATWGQQAIWDAVSTLGADAPRYNVALHLPVDPGRPAPDLLADLTALLHLHDSLRTRLLPGADGTLHQHLDAAGTVPVTLAECPADEVGPRADALLADLLALPFDTAAAWPLRVGLLEADGLVRSLSLVLSHTATDGWGVRRLHQDLMDLADGVGLPRIRALRPALQPLEQAARQTSDRGRRRDAAARRRWREVLAAGPQQLFRPLPQPGPAPALLPNARLHSPALGRAVELVAARHAVSASTVLLTAVALEQARLSGAPDALLQVVVNNRFTPQTAQAVGTMAQEGLFHLPNANAAADANVAAGSGRGGLGALLPRAQLAALACYRHAAYDKRLLDRELAELRRSGGPLADTTCTFNDARVVRADAAALAELRPDPLRRLPLGRLREHTTLHWPTEFPPRTDFTFALDALQLPDAVDLVMTADSTLLPRAAMESLLLGVEDRIVTEALAGDRA